MFMSYSSNTENNMETVSDQQCTGCCDLMYSFRDECKYQNNIKKSCIWEFITKV